MNWGTFYLTVLMVIILAFGGIFFAWCLVNMMMYNAVNDSIEAAAWEGLSKYDLTWIATRKDIDINEYRTIQLNETDAVSATRTSLMNNLMLNNSLVAQQGSPIFDRVRPVEIIDIAVINGSEVPTVVDGHQVNETTIRVKIGVPMQYFSEKKIMYFDRYIDLSDFITDKQTN